MEVSLRVFLIQWTPSRSTQTGNKRFFPPSLRITLLIGKHNISHPRHSPRTYPPPYSFTGPNLSLRSVSPTHTTPPIRLLSIANAHALFAPVRRNFFFPSPCMPACLPC